MDNKELYLPLSQIKSKINDFSGNVNNPAGFFSQIRANASFDAPEWLTFCSLYAQEFSIKSLLAYYSFLKLKEKDHITSARILLYYTSFFGISSLIFFQGRYIGGSLITGYNSINDKFILKNKPRRNSSHKIIWSQFRNLFFNNEYLNSDVWDSKIQNIFDIDFDFSNTRNKINYSYNSGFQELKIPREKLDSIHWNLPAYKKLPDTTSKSEWTPTFIIDLNSLDEIDWQHNTQKEIIERLDSEEVYTRLLLIASLTAGVYISPEYYKQLKKGLDKIFQLTGSDIFPDL